MSKAITSDFMSQMKTAKRILTRSGGKATFLANLKDAPAPLVFQIDGGSNKLGNASGMHNYFADGSYTGTKQEHPMDIVLDQNFSH